MARIALRMTLTARFSADVSVRAAYYSIMISATLMIDASKARRLAAMRERNSQ
jgi:hypothetical protein